MLPAPRRLLLVAPNVSQQMGGEALKALQIALELQRRGHHVRQIAHARVRNELRRDYPALEVIYLEDDWLQRGLHRLKLQMPLSWLNAWQLHRLAEREACKFAAEVVHFTAPISPVLPYFRFRGAPVVIGPLNGNISFPPGFGDREPLRYRLARALLKPGQAMLGTLFQGKKRAWLLVAGGPRTVVALRSGGCQEEQMVATLDCGLPDAMMDRPRARQSGRNGRFVFLGRLVGYKGCDLALRALALAGPELSLDIIGDGPERQRLEALVDALQVRNQVEFLGWLPPGAQLHEQLQDYRGLVFPSLAEANGIVFQEAMALGLPIVAVNWGGVRELLRSDEARLIEPTTPDAVVQGLAEAIRQLADEPAIAEQLSLGARRRADDLGFRWQTLLTRWEQVYEAALENMRGFGRDRGSHTVVATRRQAAPRQWLP